MCGRNAIKFYLIAYFHVVGIGPLPHDDFFFKEFKTEKECEEHALTEIPKELLSLSKYTLIAESSYQCRQFRMLGGSRKWLPKKECKTHLSGEHCLRKI